MRVCAGFYYVRWVLPERGGEMGRTSKPHAGHRYTPSGEAAHLRVSALAGVRAHGVGQRAYLAECLEDHPSEAAASGADDGVADVGLEFVRLARRADEAVRVFHAGPFVRIVSRS